MNSNIKPAASLPLQILLYYDGLYSVIYFILAFLCFIYKGYSMYYPPGILPVEVVTLFIFLIWQYVRIDIGETGNKSENTRSAVWFLILSCPAIIAFVFFLDLQTYVLMVEIVINAVGLGFIGLEFLLGIAAGFRFRKAEKTQ